MVTVGSILSGTFGFVRANVRSILVWSGLLVLLSLASMALMRPFYAQQLAEPQGGTLPMPHLGMFGLVMILFFVVFLVQYAAVFRAVLFPEQSRFAYLRLGMDELRLLGTMLILAIGGGAASSIFIAILAIIVGLLSVALGVGSTVVFTVVLTVAVFAALIYFWVRLSLAGPLTILQRKIVIGPAWRASRGHFWGLFGAYLVISLLIFAAYCLIAFVQMGPIMTDMFHPTDPAAHQRMLAWQSANYGLTLRSLVFAILGGLLYAVCTALQGGMVAVATAQLVDRGGGRRLNEVFE